MKKILIGKEINYESAGSGNTVILFVHGWGGDLRSMDTLFHFFSRNFKCFRLDLPGFGQSENPEPNWGIDEYSDLVKTFIEKIIKEKVVYCGHSFGGSIGLYLATNTNIISKMILFAPAFRRKERAQTAFSEKCPFYLKLKPLLYPFRKIGYRVLYPDSQILSYPHLEENFKKIITQTLVPILEGIDTKTLILWGDEDSFVPVEEAYFLNEKLKNSVLRVYNGIEHNLPFVKNQEVLVDITCFLNKK